MWEEVGWPPRGSGEDLIIVTYHLQKVLDCLPSPLGRVGLDKG